MVSFCLSAVCWILITWLLLYREGNGNSLNVVRSVIIIGPPTPCKMAITDSRWLGTDVTPTDTQVIAPS